LEHVDQEIAAGVPPNRIACVTFTRAARQVVLDRVGESFGLGVNDCPWFRTIHSTAYRLLELRPNQILSREQWKKFADRHHYSLSRLEADHDALEAVPPPPRATKDDLLRYAYSWGRNRRLDPERTLARFPGEGLATGDFRTFLRRLEQYKAEGELLDFNDLLERVLAGGLRPGVEVGFVDEAQDLSPLQLEVVRFWFRPCRQVYLAADDDQSVYTFQGAEPSWLVRLAAECKPKILTLSHRVPRAAHDLAQRIIRRNHIRVPKTYLPAPHAGEVRRETQAGAIKLLDGRVETFVLARNRLHLRPYASALIDRAIPFVVEGGGAPCPLADPTLIRAVNVSLNIEKGSLRVISAGDLGAVLRFVATADGLVPRGVKTRVKEAGETEGAFDPNEFCRLHGLESLIERIRHDGPLSVFTRLPRRTRRYIEVLITKYGCIPEPRIRLTSIHGSKGREAELVVLVSDMSRATHRDYMRGRREAQEAENRVFYVGVTRTWRTLVLVRPRSRRHYDFPDLRSSGSGGQSAGREHDEERAAIQEYDGGLSRSDAEKAARGATIAALTKSLHRSCVVASAEDHDA